MLDCAIWSALTGCGIAVLACARSLSPAARGVGTHVALGLPPCGFLESLGLPCPACGLTTSFAHLACAQLVPALQANPIGLPLFALTLALPPLALVSIWRGTSFFQLLDRTRADRWALLLVLALLLSWASRLLALSARATS